VIHTSAWNRYLDNEQCRSIFFYYLFFVVARKTAGNSNSQTRTYKQEIQLIQVARIGQAGAFGLAAR
jgi:hypothetical protein